MRKLKLSKIIKWILGVIFLLAMIVGDYFIAEWEISTEIFPSDSNVLLLMLINVPLLFVLVTFVTMVFDVVYTAFSPM